MESNARASFLHPVMASSAKLKQIKEAQEMTKRIQERAKKLSVPLPPYEFLELIGKGSFGRVYKSRRTKEQDLVAVKIIDVDSTDYKLGPAEKDQAIKDFVTEIQILHTLKDSKAKNVNLIHEAFNFHSQLWIVSEYCPGGSVHTLLKSSPKPGLEEKYIIAICRELAIALKYVHEAGIIHRDIKAANVLITQDGQLQLCDFGVSGILESNAGKRSTIIGTPYWMAPEMHNEDLERKGYGIEIDCWAYGCTVYELATGQPPNANIAAQHLHMFLKIAPRLEGGEYSAGLREFVSFCLEERPEDRPSAEGILQHIFIANTSRKYPTSILRQLIERFAQWESAGGQRASLFQPHGASAPTAYDPFAPEDEDDWNFSTTDDFVVSRLAPQTPDLTLDSAEEEATPRPSTAKIMTPFEKAQQDLRAARGGRKMARLFDENAEPYEYALDDEDEDSVYMSDLPLRRGSASLAANRETIIDLDEARLSKDVTTISNLDLADVDTIKDNRGRLRFLYDDDEEEGDPRVLTKRMTRDWRFPSAEGLRAPATDRPRTQDWSFSKAAAEASYISQSADEDTSEPRRSSSHLAPPFRPILKHTTTEPLGSFGDFLHPATATDTLNLNLSSEPPDRSSMIDEDGPGFSTLSRQYSFASSAGESSATDFTHADPFYLDDEEAAKNENTLRAKRSHRASFHVHSQSEPSAGDRTSTGYSIHTRGGSLSSETELERQQRHDAGINSAPISRTISVKDSIDSLRQSTDDDEDYLDRGLVYGLRDGLKPSKQPLINGWNINKRWGSYDTDEAASSAADVDASDLDTASHKYGMPTYGQANSSPRTRLGPQASRYANRGRQFRHGRSRSKYEYPRSGDTVFDDPEREATDEDKTVVLASYNRHRRVVSFPRPQAPDFVALEEDAEQETVIDEIDRLLDDYVLGLRAVGTLLGDCQHDEISTNQFRGTESRGPFVRAGNLAPGYESSRSVSMNGE